MPKFINRAKLVKSKLALETLMAPYKDKLEAHLLEKNYNIPRLVYYIRRATSGKFFNPPFYLIKKVFKFF